MPKQQDQHAYDAKYEFKAAKYFDFSSLAGNQDDDDDMFETSSARSSMCSGICNSLLQQDENSAIRPSHETNSSSSPSNNNITTNSVHVSPKRFSDLLQAELPPISHVTVKRKLFI